MMRFQSLFSWMSLWNILWRECHRSLHRSFNPCSRGCRSGTPGDRLMWWKDLGFNPCSRGCRSGTRAIIQDQGEQQSFNPCSRGCRSGTRDSEEVYRMADVFQSLFSWMSLWNADRKRGEAAATLKFQSLFSWMSLWNEMIYVSISATMFGFNPCSRGCRSGTLSGRDGRPYRKCVSILVLVDVALERKNWEYIRCVI